MEDTPNIREQYYDSDEGVAWGPLTLPEIKKFLKRKPVKPERRYTDIGEYTFDLRSEASSTYYTPNETTSRPEPVLDQEIDKNESFHSSGVDHSFQTALDRSTPPLHPDANDTIQKILQNQSRFRQIDDLEVSLVQNSTYLDKLEPRNDALNCSLQSISEESSYVEKEHKQASNDESYESNTSFGSIPGCSEQKEPRNDALNCSLQSISEQNLSSDEEKEHKQDSNDESNESNTSFGSIPDCSEQKESRNDALNCSLQSISEQNLSSYEEKEHKQDSNDESNESNTSFGSIPGCSEQKEPENEVIVIDDSVIVLSDDETPTEQANLEMVKLEQSFSEFESKSASEVFDFNDTLSEMEHVLKYGFENAEISEPNSDKIEILTASFIPKKISKDSHIPKPKSSSQAQNKYRNVLSPIGAYINSKTPVSTFKLPAPPQKLPKPVLCNSKYRDIVSPVAVYCKNSPAPVLKQNVHAKKVETIQQNAPETIVAMKENNGACANLPDVIYRSAKNVVIVKDGEKQIVLPNSIKKLVNEPIISLRMKQNDKHQDKDRIRRKLDLLDLTIANQSNCNDMSIVVEKQGFKK